MSLCKVLEEVPNLRRFQPVQRGEDAVELRLLADEPQTAFGAAKAALLAFFAAKGLQVTVALDHRPPQPGPVSGIFKHVYRAIE